jgi:hypothetical protein
MLELSERQKLRQNAALDFRETPTPPALVVALGFGLWLAGWRWLTRGSPGRQTAELARTGPAKRLSGGT